jgi:hypothetical protein
MEHDGGMSRQDAERLAEADVRRRYECAGGDPAQERSMDDDAEVA